MRGVALSILCACALAGPATAHAQSDAVRRAALVLKVLSYVQGLESRVDGSVAKVLVVYEHGNAQSKDVMRATVEAINAVGQRTTVAGLRARAVSHAYRGKNRLKKAVRQEKPATLFVCPGLSDEASDISFVSRLTDVLSMGMSKDIVRSGVSVGLVPQGSSLQLVVNLHGTKREGVNLSAEMLRAAEVLRR